MSVCFSGVKEYTLHLAIEATNTVCCEKFYFPSVSLNNWSSPFFHAFVVSMLYMQLLCLCGSAQQKKPKPAGEPSATLQQHFANKLHFLRAHNAEIACGAQLEELVCRDSGCFCALWCWSF